MMDINKAIENLKKEPGFTDNVGMMLVHNGVVRGWSRKDHRDVSDIDISVDQDKVEEIRKEIAAYPGIFRAYVEARGGHLKPGDDVLLLVVAGDIREHVKPALADFLDRVKAEAYNKKETFA